MTNTIPKATQKVLSKAELETALAERRAQGDKIVFTNGCFDILHVGHARYLAQARELGDLLVVGINSDHSVQVLKGPSRPIVNEQERAEMLAHLDAVDYICMFDEQRPDALLEVVRPDIHAKGGDYTEDQLPEAAVVKKHGGSIAILPLVEGKSTTNIVKRILEAYRESE